MLPSPAGGRGAGGEGLRPPPPQPTATALTPDPSPASGRGEKDTAAMPALNLLPPVMPFRWACAYGEDRTGLWQAFEVAGVRQVMRWIPPGEFLMGSLENEPERNDNEHQHRVVLNEGFWLADTACTQALWTAVMHTNPSRFKSDPQNPVEQVSWDDICLRFLLKINEISPELQLELPTEAQWEYACRAGTTTPFSIGTQISTDQVNYNGDFPYANGPKGIGRQGTVPVKALHRNPWGLYQMHGNVWEWCADKYSRQHSELDTNEGRRRSLRGGSWDDAGRGCRSADRFAHKPDGRGDRTGFRLVRGAC